jgi:hypothetical protein
MKHLSTALLGGAAVVALMAASGPARAFDKVDWSWNLGINETINKLITIDVTFDPTGVVNVEIPQVFIGNSESTATTSDVHNNPQYSVTPLVSTWEGTGTTDGSLGVYGKVGDHGEAHGTTYGSLDVSGTAQGFVDIDQGNWTSGCDVVGTCTGPGTQDDRIGLIGIAGQPAGNSLTENGVSGSYGSEDPLTVDGTTSGQLGVKTRLDDPYVHGGTYGDLGVTVSGTITTYQIQPLDALKELPLLKNSATALDNNMSVDSTKMIEAHTGQFAFNSDQNANIDPTRLTYQAASALADWYVNQQADPNHNTNQDLLVGLTGAAITGVIAPSIVSANASVSDVSNVQVDNSATALANNASFTLNGDTNGDAVMLGDVSQFAYANVTSNATLNCAYVDNYTNLGKLSGPLFSNVATSIGNNLSIKVSGPAAVSVPPVSGGGGTQ